MLLDSLRWILFHTPLNSKQHLYLGVLDAIFSGMGAVCVCVCVEAMLLGAKTSTVTSKFSFPQ